MASTGRAVPGCFDPPARCEDVRMEGGAASVCMHALACARARTHTHAHAHAHAHLYLHMHARISRSGSGSVRSWVENGSA